MKNKLSRRTPKIYFVLNKIFLALITVLALVIALFFLIRLMPGGPLDLEASMPESVRLSLIEKFKLNEPVFKQLIFYLRSLLSGDFGISFRYYGTRSVQELIFSGFYISLVLGIFAFLISISFGVALGVLSSYNRNTCVAFCIQGFKNFCLSLPNYFFASVLILIFSVKLKWFEVALWENWQSAILPIATLSLRPMGLYIGLTSSAISEISSSDYIQTARSKGLSELQIILNHILRPALVSILSLGGHVFASIVTGSFVVETVFAIPGLGRVFISSILDRDYPVILGSSIIFCLVMVFVNLLIELLSSTLDPRLRL